jgi:exodeoxyribonuclease III
MRISTWNVNGLRSSVRQGLHIWLKRTQSDIVCLQEAKAEEDLLGSLWFPGYTAYWSPSLRPGYSGVVTLLASGLTPYRVIKGIGDPEIDLQGRVLTVELPDLQIINVYAPHSHRQLHRLPFKLRFLDALSAYIGKRRQESAAPLVITGDLNVAHRDIDVANFAANRRNAGFLPEERGWLDRMLASGFLDAFREFCPDSGHYTWWSPIKGVRERNIGWRLDYVLVDQGLRGRLKGCFHSPEQMGSDHCPVTADIE